MPALDSADLKAILGEDYLARKDELERASGFDAAERDAKARLEKLSGQKAPALCGAFLGLLLVVATKWSATPTAATNQTIIGSGLIVVSLCLYFWIRNELNKGNQSG
jgi:hypothetical protein